MWRFLKVPRLLRCNALQKNHQIWQKFSKKIKTILPETISPYMGFGYWSITSSHHFLCRIIPSLSGPFIHALVDKCFLGLNDFFLIIKALDAQLAKNGKTVPKMICVRESGCTHKFYCGGRSIWITILDFEGNLPRLHFFQILEQFGCNNLSHKNKNECPLRK